MLDELRAQADELVRHRETFGAYLARLDETALTAKRADDEYSPRQSLAHLVGASLSMMQIGKRMAAGEEPRLRADFDLNFWNQRQQEKRASRDLQELLKDWRAAHAELFAFLETLTESDLVKRGEHPVVGNTDLRGLVHVIVDHEVEHMERVMHVPA